MADIEMKERGRGGGGEEEKEGWGHENDLEETSFTADREHDLNDDDDDAKYQDLPRDHPLRKMWGRVKQKVKADPTVDRNEKVQFLDEHLDIKVYRDYFSRLLLENIEIGRDRRGEDSYLEYRDHKVYVKRSNGEWNESKNPLNKKYITEFNKLVDEIKLERLNSPAGEIERLMNLDVSNPQEKHIEWFAEREAEDVNSENVKARLQTVLDYLQENEPGQLQKINDLMLDISNLNNNRKPETQIGKDLLQEEIESLKNVNRIQKYLRENFGGLLVIVSVIVGATSVLVALLEKQLHRARKSVHDARVDTTKKKVVASPKKKPTKQQSPKKPPVTKEKTVVHKKLPPIIDVPAKHLETALVHTTNNMWTSFFISLAAGYAIYSFTKKN